jgi:thiol-disulfide isomerase/thioredoxin
MKKTVFVFISMLLLLMNACTSHDGYIIEGSLAGIESGSVILTNNSNFYPASDTAVIKNGLFRFSGKVTTPEMYSLYVDSIAGRFDFFLTNGTIKITGCTDSLWSSTITGPKITEEIDNLQKAKNSLMLDASASIVPDGLFEELEHESTTPERRAELQVIYEQVMEEMMQAMQKAINLEAEYAKAHPYSPFTVQFLATYPEHYAPQELETLVEDMKKRPELQSNYYLKVVADYVTNTKGTAIGGLARDFTQNDPSGNPLTFSDVYKNNKLTMIDFWASWCGPCRRSNPLLVKLYKQYHPKGLEIIGVSCDNDREEWLKAVADDKLTWLQVSDLRGWTNEVTQLYNIRSIPQNILVDANGIIVAKQLSENDLEQFLAEQFK